MLHFFLILRKKQEARTDPFDDPFDDFDDFDGLTPLKKQELTPLTILHFKQAVPKAPPGQPALLHLRNSNEKLAVAHRMIVIIVQILSALASPRKSLHLHLHF